MFAPTKRNLIIAGSVGIIGLILLSLALNSNAPPPPTYAQPAPQYAPQAPVAQPTPQYTPQAPVVVQTAPAQNSNDGLLTGLVIGHMLSGGGGNNAPTTVNRTTVVHQTVVAPPRPAYVAPRPVAPSYTYRPAPSRPSSYSYNSGSRRIRTTAVVVAVKTQYPSSYTSQVADTSPSSIGRTPGFQPDKRWFDSTWGRHIAGDTFMINRQQRWKAAIIAYVLFLVAISAASLYVTAHFVSKYW